MAQLSVLAPTALFAPFDTQNGLEPVRAPKPPAQSIVGPLFLFQESRTLREPPRNKVVRNKGVKISYSYS